MDRKSDDVSNRCRHGLRHPVEFCVVCAAPTRMDVVITGLLIVAIILFVVGIVMFSLPH